MKTSPCLIPHAYTFSLPWSLSHLYLIPLRFIMTPSESEKIQKSVRIALQFLQTKD